MPDDDLPKIVYFRNEDDDESPYSWIGYAWLGYAMILVSLGLWFFA